MWNWMNDDPFEIVLEIDLGPATKTRFAPKVF